MTTADADVATEAGLRHVVVVGGTPAEWARLGELGWQERLRDLGKAADHAGASWLTLRPFGPDDQRTVAADVPRRTAIVGGCIVVADPEPDGRERLVGVIDEVASHGGPVTDEAVVAALNAPAEVDPDLVVVLGPSHRLPASLVWELAYAELVFLDVAWADLQVAHLGEALVAFAHRHRRFGGLD